METKTIITPEVRTHIESLLNVAWSSEHMLNMLPAFDTQEQHLLEVRWLLPQAWYAASASLRAAKAAQGEFITARPSIVQAGYDLAEQGHYGPLRLNLIEVLECHVGQYGQPPLYVDKKAVCTIHDLLRVVCAQVMSAHELILVDVLGLDWFEATLQRQDTHLRQGNVANRVLIYAETAA